MNKRIWALVGLIYMLILIALNTYALATGSFLYGLMPLLLIPAIIGLGVVVIFRYRAGEVKRQNAVFIVLLCLVALVLNLILGIPSLLSNF